MFSSGSFGELCIISDVKIFKRNYYSSSSFRPISSKIYGKYDNRGWGGWVGGGGVIQAITLYVFLSTLKTWETIRDGPLVTIRHQNKIVANSAVLLDLTLNNLEGQNLDRINFTPLYVKNGKKY